MDIRKNIDIVVLGSGNVATQLSLAMYNCGYKIRQIYSRSKIHAEVLANNVNAQHTDKLKDIIPNADLYIIAISDNAIADIGKALCAVGGLVVHTSGSIGMDVLQNNEHYGVFYPLQTFSKERIADFENIPVLIETFYENDKLFLSEIAESLKMKVYFIGSEQRRYVHLAAVFTCNFTNHMYVLAQKILTQKQIDFEMLRPLIMETALKACDMLPNQAQTGPALRGDSKVMEKHIDMLSEFEDLKEIYQIISRNIAKENKDK